jgi:hypothetical protein
VCGNLANVIADHACAAGKIVLALTAIQDGQIISMLERQSSLPVPGRIAEATSAETGLLMTCLGTLCTAE